MTESYKQRKVKTNGRGDQPRRKEYVWENVSLQKLIYMTIYDTLVKMFRKISQERKRVGIFCILRKVWRVQVCDISEIWRLVKMEKWCLRSLYIGSWSKWELSRPKASRKSLSVGSALHRWMCETARRLEHLIVLCEPRNVSSKSEAHELSTPRVWIEESCDLVSWKSKPCFFSFYKREKPKFWGAIVGAEVQNSYVLGLGLTRVQIDKYWIIILIQEPELPRR